jgi:DMSO/TMAO reductase YedYZ molybdopterin-dependent catalytic subunit
MTRRSLTIVFLILLLSAVFAFGAETLAGSGLSESKTADSFPDNAMTKEVLKTGNRGCLSCHASLAEQVKKLERFKESEPKRHMYSSPGYGKPDHVKYCLMCHTGTPLSGPKLGPSIHTLHADNMGNCFSCHHVNAEGKLVLWDMIKYEQEAFGYAGSLTPFLEGWAKRRGFSKGNFVGFDMDSELKGTIAFSQDVITPLKDLFMLYNHGLHSPIKADDYKLTIKGLVNRETTYSVEQLKGKEQRDSILAMSCLANPPGGGFIANVKWSGVPLKALLDEAGVKPGANAIHVTGYDNWDWYITLDRAKNHDTLLAMKLNDGELKNETGYPVRLVPVGGFGVEFVNWVKTIEVVKAEIPTISFQHGISPNSGFLKPDTGARVKAGSSVVIEGWAYGGGMPTMRIAKLHLSGDYGKTWRVFPVPLGDPYRWQYWKFEWQPPGPGTYLLKVKTEDEKGKVQPAKPFYSFMPDPLFPDSLVVTVE